MRKARLLELLSFSGGVTDAASGIVQIFRTQPPMCSDGDEEAWDPGTNNGLEIPNRIYSLGMLRQGDPKANPLIYPGDIVVVQKTAPVYIVGEVKSPQGIYIPEGGLKLTQAISMVGGLNTGAKSKDIKIYRRIPNSVDSQIISLNYDLIRKGEQKDVMLEPYDQIEVDKKKPSIAKVLLDNLIRAGNMIPQTLGSGIGTRILY
jgi:protein involved in polysaccharide export with SLBB domain